MKIFRSKSARSAAALLAAALICAIMTVPQLAVRTKAEAGNRAVVLSVLFSDLQNRVGAEAAPEFLDRFREAGATAATLPEDTMSTLVVRGDITGLRYHDIRHRYDSEGAEVERLLDGVPGIRYNSHVFLVKRQNIEERFDEWLPLYYTDADYVKAGHAAGAAVYVFFDSGVETYDIPVGYDEEAMELIAGHGLDIALSMRVGAHSSVGYIDKTAALADRYGVRYFNVKKDSFSRDSSENAAANADGIAALIRESGMTLVVTENVDQLSNVRPIGYDKIFEAAEGRVLRSFETYDHSQPDKTGYMFRHREYMNSITDRNIRFITVTQLSFGGKSSETLADDTASAVRATADRLGELGYRTDGETVQFNYENNAFTRAAAAAFVSLSAFAIIPLVFGVGGVAFTAASFAASACAFAATFFVPRSLLLLYPTALALVVPCLAVSLALTLSRAMKNCRATAIAAAEASLTVAVVCVGGAVMAALTSGLGYYINNDIFRGIKISLYAPLLFAAAAYYFMFVHEKGMLARDLGAALNAKVSVWWCVVAACAAVVSFIYILRSGNVSSIGSLEMAMRSFLTDHIPARPRTKEFLVAYPCVMIFARHCRDRARLVPWIAAIGAAILPASLMNTFCHVFTDVGIQYGRVVWGLLIGVFTAAAALAADALVTRVYNRLKACADGADARN